MIEEEQLPQITDAYNHLTHLIRSNQDLREFELVKNLNFLDKIHSQETKLFNLKYKIFEVDRGIWKDKPLTADKMEKTIELLGKNSDELKTELEEEQKQFQIWQEKKLETQIQIPPK